jgi:transglutaminase-like putative cysteine protease
MMLRPKEGYDQRIRAFHVAIAPDPVELRHVHDVFGNCVSIARFDGRAADRLSFESRVVLEHEPAPLVSDAEEAITAGGPTFPFAYGPEDMPDLLRSIERHHADPGGLVAAWARRRLRPSGATPVLSLLVQMTHDIHEGFAYAKRFDGLTQSPAQTLELKTGTCRDFAVLMIEAARSLGLAARFVSGYVHSPLAGKGAGDGASARQGGGHTHAWVQVYLPSCGWVEFDPTNGIVGSTDLIKVAVVRDPRQATPLSGSWNGEADDFLGMDVEVDIVEAPEGVRRSVRRAA